MSRLSTRILLLALAVTASLGTPLTSYAQQAPATATPQSPGAGPSGAAGPPIESIILEYQALAESASRIASAIAYQIQFNPTTKTPKVAVVTTTDIAAMVQLKEVLGQASLITNRLDKLAETVPLIKCGQTPTANVYGASPINLTSPLANASNIQTMLQTVASIFAVTQTVSPAAGSLNDTSLINLVVSRLPQGTVYVPSVYPPYLYAEDFGATKLWNSLTNLETARQALYKAADGKIYSPACQTKALAPTLVVLAAQVAAASALADNFEVSLFGGQPSPPPGGPNANTGGAPAGGAAAPSQQTPAPSPPPMAAAASLPQLLYADYLLRHIDSSSYFVTLHSLESGGNTMTKSNLFAGSHVFFSGGAVSTFSLYGPDGTVICSGISYAYRGFVPEDKLNAAIADSQNPGTLTDSTGDAQPPIGHYTSNCPNATIPTPGSVASPKPST